MVIAVISKFFLCISIVLVSVSSGSSTEGDESSLRKYSKRATYVAAAVGAIYTVQQLINDAMGSSKIPMDTPEKRALSYSQAVFASLVLDETLKWAYAAGHQALKKIGRYKFGNKTRHVIQDQKDSKKLSLKEVYIKEEWIHRMSSRTSVGIGVFDSFVTAYFLCNQMSHLCTEPFDALSAFGFLEVFCMGAVIVGNAKCLIFSEEFDEKLPWRQFSNGMRKGVINPHLSDWKIDLYNRSLAQKTYGILDTKGPIPVLTRFSVSEFNPTATLRCVEFLHLAFVGSFTKDVLLGADKIFHNAWDGWKLWKTDEQIYQQNRVPAPKPPRLEGATKEKDVPYFSRYDSREFREEPAPAKREKIKTRGISDGGDVKEEPAHQPQVNIPEDLLAVLTELSDITPPLKESDFKALLNAAIKYRERNGATVIREQGENILKIKVTRDGKEITLVYEPTHKQHGQNAAEYSGSKLANALRVVQNLYLIDTPLDVQDELDGLGLVRRIKGVRGFIGYALTNK